MLMWILSQLKNIWNHFILMIQLWYMSTISLIFQMIQVFSPRRYILFFIRGNVALYSGWDFINYEKYRCIPFEEGIKWPIHASFLDACCSVPFAISVRIGLSPSRQSWRLLSFSVCRELASKKNGL